MYYELIFKICGIIFACGTIYGELKAIRKDISRLEKKQEAYNNLQIRVLKGEIKMDNYDKVIAELKEQVNERL